MSGKICGAQLQTYVFEELLQFIEYSKLIYLDGDIQVFDNIDHLFDNEDGYFYAVMDCFCEKTWSASPQYKIGYCQQCPDKVQWQPELSPRPPLYFKVVHYCTAVGRLAFNFQIMDLRPLRLPLRWRSRRNS